MTSPIEPTYCKNTGRILTEWFEFPEYDDKQLEELACAAFGIDVKDRPKVRVNPETHTDAEAAIKELSVKINTFIAGRKNRTWKHAMSKQEVHARMNEATKMIDPSNYKFLNDDVRERTGLEVNPLWMIECLVRSGVLSPKEQINALQQLAQYTHSKAPTIAHSTHTEMKPEDWLMELAKEEYTVITEDDIKQPRQPIEKMMGQNSGRATKRARDIARLQDFGSKTLSDLESLFDDAEFEDIDDDS